MASMRGTSAALETPPLEIYTIQRRKNAEAKEQELQCTSVAAQMEGVQPSGRSIFENRKKPILDANLKSFRKEHSAEGAAKSQTKDKANFVEDHEKMLESKVQALDEDVAIFKSLAKEHNEGWARWGEQKMQAFQTQEEEQVS